MAKKKDEPKAEETTKVPASTAPMQKMTKMLPCELTGEERHAKASELARELSALQELKDQKKEEASSFAVKIKATEAKIDALRETVATGREDRAVECERRPNYAAAKWEFIRLDTQKCADWIPMSTSERQLQIPGANLPVEGEKPKVKKGAAKPEEAPAEPVKDAKGAAANDDSLDEAWSDDLEDGNDKARAIADEQAAKGIRPEANPAPVNADPSRATAKPKKKGGK